jgi:hypothetical protein
VTADGQDQTIHDPTEAQRRATVLTAVLNRLPHDDPSSLPTKLSRYAIVHCYAASSDATATGSTCSRIRLRGWSSSAPLMSRPASSILDR